MEEKGSVSTLNHMTSDLNLYLHLKLNLQGIRPLKFVPITRILKK
jgi:hypothetical protein